MILADTSIWVRHLREPDPVFTDLLANHRVLMHSLIIGEVCVGNLPNRRRFIADLEALTPVTEARHQDALEFLHAHALHGRGIGWVDVHLLASVKLGSGQFLWSRDRRLMTAAETLGVAARPLH